jgi:two-component system cell cycle sensor histidine kinase PleC
VTPQFAALRKLARQAGADRPEQGMAGLLALGLMAAFGVGLTFRAQDVAQEAQSQALDAAHAEAAVAAERANGLLIEAWGALEAAAESAGPGPLGAEAVSVARAAATADAVAGALVLDANGRTLAATASGLSGFAADALAQAGERPAWAGVARDRRGGVAAVLVRRIDGQSIVAVIRPPALAPGATERVVLADSEGRVIAGAGEGTDGATIEGVLGLVGEPPSLESRHIFTEAPGGERLAVGFAGLTGGLRVYVARAADAPAGEILAAVLSYALLLGAPALGALLAMFFAARRETERAETAEERLDQVRRHFRLAVDGARAGVWTWRRREDRIEFSERMQWMLRSGETSLAVTKFLMLAAEEDRQRLQQAFSQARLSGALEVTFRIVGDDGVHWVEMRGVAVEEEPGGEPVIVGTALDATPQHKAELRMHAVERRLNAAIESFSGPFALFDHRRRLAAWNRAFAAVFRLGTDVLRRGAPYDVVFDRIQRTILGYNQDAVDPQAREIEVEQDVWYQLVERTTQEGGVVVVGVDISTLKAQARELEDKERTMRKAMEALKRSEGLQKELKKKYEIEKVRAEEANRAKTAFLHNMSHELRTPLNAINGFSDMMTQQVYGPLGHDKYLEYAKDIHVSGELLLDMINDILDMAKIEAGKFNLNPKPLDPLVAIEQAVRLMRPRAEQKNLALNVDADDAPEIVADHRAVKQILLNLLSNALKFTKEGGVQVRAQSCETGLVLQVADTGPGIPEAALSRLARPFEQVDHGDSELSRSNTGTGLGLAITRTLVQMHGGSFEIKSALGRGTVVTVRLPFEPAPPSEAVRPQLLGGTPAAVA